MKMRTDKLFFCFFFLSCAWLKGLAQFEGVIAFRKITGSDTVQYVYYVKGNLVRIDELTKHTGIVSGSLIANLDKSSIVSLNRERKIFMDYKPTGAAPVGFQPQVTPLESVAAVAGVKCKGFELKNPTDGTVVTYSIGSNNCGFVKKLLALLQRKDKISVYFQLLKEANDGFPFLAVMKDAAGKVDTRLEVTQFTAKSIDAGLFAIPADFQPYK